MILGDKNNNDFVLNIHDKEIKNSSEVELIVCFYHVTYAFQS